MSGKDEDQKFSNESIRAGELRPGRKLLCSVSAGWKSVLLQIYEQPSIVEPYESAPSPDQLLVVVLKGHYSFESFSTGSWRKATYRPGISGLTAPMVTNRLRWHGLASGQQVVLRLYIPQIYFLEAQDEYRRAGERVLSASLNTLSFDDPVLFAMARSLTDEAARSAPDLYAEAGSRFLAAHLLSRLNCWSAERLKRRSVAGITDRRMLQVLDFMQHHCTAPLTLDQLAGQAGVSRFHFTRLFKQKFGVTPHQHLMRLRMKYAKSLLAETDLSIAEIALTCGYQHHGHFSAEFYRQYGVTPAKYRSH